MQHLTSDVSGADLAEPEATVLRISGPLRSMLGRSRVELSKPAALALARWLDPDISRPGLEEIEGPEPVRSGQEPNTAGLSVGTGIDRK